MNAMKRHTLAILAAVLAACIIIVGMTCPAALAAEQLLRANGKHYEYFLDGKPYVIGVNAESRSGKFYYCRQIESVTDYKVTETTTVENTEAARRLAWLLSEYQHDGEPVLTYAAIGVLVHRNYDDQKVWVRHEQYLFSVMDGLESKVNELWEEAANKLPVSSRVTRDDRQGLRSGSLFVQLLDSSGQPVEGVFTATIEGPAVFDEDDEPTAVGWAELEGTTVYWHATGAGEVNIKVGYQSVGLDEAVTAQKMMVLNDVVEREDSLLTFNVDNLYAPEQEMPQTGSPMGLVLGLAAAVMAAMGAAQIAIIAKTPVMTGMAEGGLFDVVREQDGRRFPARLSPERRGFIDRPTVLVGEAGGEYVIPAEGLANPTLAPLIATIEGARRNGTLKSLNMEAVYPATMPIPGRAEGGYTGTAPKTKADSGGDIDPRMAAVLEKLLKRLDDPVKAYVSVLGKNGIKEAYDKYENHKNRGRL